MALRDGLSWQLRITPMGRFLRTSMFDGRRNHFMCGRGKPYEGWRDRRAISRIPDALTTSGTHIVMPTVFHHITPGHPVWRKRKVADVHLDSGEIVRAEAHCGFSGHLIMPKVAEQLVICLDNSGYEVSLKRRKIYAAIPDPRAESLGQSRVVDESGEDYFYPEKNFAPADLPQGYPTRGAASDIG
jgi:hypothetical protein